MRLDRGEEERVPAGPKGCLRRDLGDAGELRIARRGPPTSSGSAIPRTRPTGQGGGCGRDGDPSRREIDFLTRELPAVGLGNHPNGEPAGGRAGPAQPRRDQGGATGDRGAESVRGSTFAARSAPGRSASIRQTRRSPSLELLTYDGEPGGRPAPRRPSVRSTLGARPPKSITTAGLQIGSQAMMSSSSAASQSAVSTATQCVGRLCRTRSMSPARCPSSRCRMSPLPM